MGMLLGAQSWFDVPVYAPGLPSAKEVAVGFQQISLTSLGEVNWVNRSGR